MAETRASTSTQLLDCVYKEDADFPRGMLPTKKEVLCAMLYLLKPSRAGKYQRDAQGMGKKWLIKIILGTDINQSIIFKIIFQNVQ